MNISGTLAYNIFMALFRGKKSRAGMKSQTQFLKKKQRVFLAFESFVRYEINLGTCSIMRPIHIYLAISKVYLEKCVVWVYYEKRARSDFEDEQL